jgi:hypothetical protein
MNQIWHLKLATNSDSHRSQRRKEKAHFTIKPLCLRDFVAVFWNAFNEKTNHATKPFKTVKKTVSPCSRERFCGAIKLSFDPLVMQKIMRQEWERGG